ncbi:hypothetical protein Pcinc_038897 [Petrolisthes cinctipes]|uniref:Uncharacterized protein n=1 Tax=Petrolisthes cinctipes TaxID=88211 RepID=A0AAE1EJZ7_PETCI|nr:hypothetical protein Pcinc_038897 [Petrolisthes cinctipes]
MISGRLRHHRHRHHGGCVAGGGCFDIWPPPSPPPPPPWRLCGGWRLLRYLAASVTTDAATMEAVWRVIVAVFIGAGWWWRLADSILGRHFHRRRHSCRSRHRGRRCGGWGCLVVAVGTTLPGRHTQPPLH